MFTTSFGLKNRRRRIIIATIKSKKKQNATDIISRKKKRGMSRNIAIFTYNKYVKNRISSWYDTIENCKFDLLYKINY